MKNLFEKNRLEALTDGIYAIAMTLLVLNVDIEKITEKVNNVGLYKTLVSMWPIFFSYFLGFFLLATLWLVHYRQCRRVKYVDEKYVWINILGLLFISLIPFSTSLISDYGNLLVAAIFFHINLLLAGLVFFWQWTYISNKNELLVESINANIISRMKWRNLLLPITSVIAIAVALVSPGWSMAVYMLIAPIKRFLLKSDD